MNARVLVLAVVVVAALVAAAPNVDRQFADFVQKYNRVYDAEEYEFRKSIFQDNLKRFAEIQAKNPQARFGVNKFADLTEEEFAATYLSAIPLKKKSNAPYKTDFDGPRHPGLVGSPDPESYDWNADAGVVTGVYNQGQCGDCWAFSATETIESYWCLAGNTLTSLSVEQIIDCNARDAACGGGFPEIAYGYTIKVGGLESLAEYPYVAENGTPSNCSFNGTGIVASIQSYQQIDGEQGMYNQMSSASGGPVGACVDASSWQGYQGGILTSCGDTLDHCIQVTGYANYNGSQPYWIVRNSWGTDWGESGYIWIQIGSDLCGIADHAVIVTI